MTAAASVVQRGRGASAKCHQEAALMTGIRHNGSKNLAPGSLCDAGESSTAVEVWARRARRGGAGRGGPDEERRKGTARPQGWWGRKGGRGERRETPRNSVIGNNNNFYSTF
ncbi:hypothetical protein E2C01_051460 [Portunus trituberculatus]|uniref:Uncharacterized protein n=1 Tax=Portunus trituberculatus TaxID=210409 RepID=A0A5B7GB16_PORTR|nr:hypothetical protein [Portunus trituberculatus]